jgi:murein L,D-transpeptidase YcbB/YkuD
MRYLIFVLMLCWNQAMAFTSDEEFDMLESAVEEAVSVGDNLKANFLRQAIQDRIDWLIEHPETKYVIVNVNAQELHTIDNGQSVIHEKVIVGREGMETPIFENAIQSIVFNPVWNIPPDLADGMLPKMQEVGGWNGYNIYVDGTLVDDINQVSVGSDYRIIQDPSETNALGKIKFYLPNKYGVYIHDTSNRELFKEDDRRFSAGCIRMEHASKLAAYLLSSDVEAIDTITEERTSMEIPLSVPVPVHIVRWSVWFDIEGNLRYL